MPRYRRSRTPGASYFFTVVTHYRRKLLMDDTSRKCLRNAVEYVRLMHPFAIDAWVLMPDHMHCIWTLPAGDADFSKRWGMIKANFSKQLAFADGKLQISNRPRLKHRESMIWQRRFWEHQIRDQADFNRHMDYIHWNPVKHGLVERVIDWPYSSFHRYSKEGVYSADWGVSEKTFDQQSFGEVV